MAGLGLEHGDGAGQAVIDLAVATTRSLKPRLRAGGSIA